MSAIFSDGKVYNKTKFKSGGLMTKQKLTTHIEFDTAMKQFIDDFFVENPIYKALNLSEAQMEILVEKLIMPEFKARFEYEMKVMGKWAKG